MGAVYGKGTPIRQVRERQGHQLRQRGGAVVQFEPTEIDHTGADALTDATIPAGRTLGDMGVASSARATALKVSALVNRQATVAVATEGVGDDLIGHYEVAAGGTGEHILVQALVEADASATAGALLVLSSVGGYGCFRTVTVEPAQIAFARLETAATSAGDLSFGTDPAIVVRWVQLFPQGVPTGLEQAGTVDTDDLADEAVTTDKIAPDAVTGDQLADDAVGGEHIEDDAVDSEHYAAQSIDREHLSEPESAPIMRWAPDFDLRHSPAGTTVHYVGDTWAPTAGDYTMGVTVVATQYPTATASTPTLLGLDAANTDALTVESDGDIRIRSNLVTLATITGGYIKDGEPHRYQITRAANAITVYRDGVSIGTATATVAMTSTPFAARFGDAVSGIAGTRIVYDCELTDPAAATNNVFLRMDRPGQLCLNACSDPSDPLYSANTTNLGGSITSTPSGLARPRPTLVTTYRAGARSARSDEAAHPPRMAAYSGLGAASTDGYWASIAHVPTATASYDISFDYTGNVLPSGTAYAIGSDFNGPRISLESNGSASLRYVTTNIAAPGTIINVFDGRTHRVRVTLAQNGANVDGVLYIDGRFAGSGSTAGTIASGNFFIGSSGTAAQRCPGAITNVRILDVTTPANSIELLMDEPSGNFTNVYPSTTAAASATRRGYVPMRAIPSVDGRGMPWVGNQGSYVYSANNASGAQSGVTGAVEIDLTEVLDPTASFAANELVCPAAGVITGSLTGTLAETAAAASVVNIGIAKDTTIQGASIPVRVAASTTGVPFAHNVGFSVAKGDIVRAYIASISGGGTIDIESANLHLEFRPTPTAG